MRNTKWLKGENKKLFSHHAQEATLCEICLEVSHHLCSTALNMWFIVQ